MSGKRQHFIPRFLQRGFASHVSADQTFTWVYRNGRSPFNTNVINVGVEGQFYTTEQDTTADDLITAVEGEFSRLVDTLRSCAPGPVDEAQIPYLLAHLEVRTRHLRESFFRTGDLLIRRLLDFLSDEDAFAAFMTRRLTNDPSIMRESFADELRRRQLPDQFLDSLMQVAAPLIPMFIELQKVEFPRMAASLREQLPSVLKAAAKSGHIRGLASSVVPMARVETYAPLQFHVVEIADQSLVLGDSAVFFHVSGPRQLKPILDKDDVLKAVFLPLHPARVLIGSNGDFTIPSIDIRESAVRCSLEYFISSRNSADDALLSAAIGSDSALLTDEEIEEIVAEIMQS